MVSSMEWVVMAVVLFAAGLLTLIDRRVTTNGGFTRRVDRWRVRYWNRHRRWPGRRHDPLVKLEDGSCSNRDDRADDHA
jgi:hypothetical protein